MADSKKHTILVSGGLLQLGLNEIVLPKWAESFFCSSRKSDVFFAIDEEFFFLSLLFFSCSDYNSDKFSICFYVDINP